VKPRRHPDHGASRAGARGQRRGVGIDQPGIVAAAQWASTTAEAGEQVSWRGPREWLAWLAIRGAAETAVERGGSQGLGDLQGRKGEPRGLPRAKRLSASRNKRASTGIKPGSGATAHRLGHGRLAERFALGLSCSRKRRLAFWKGVGPARVVPHPPQIPGPFRLPCLGVISDQIPDRGQRPYDHTGSGR